MTIYQTQRLRGRESAQKTLGKTPHDADGLRAALQLRTSSLNAILAARQDWDDAFAALSEALACEQLARDMLKALQDTHLPVLASTSTLLAAQGVAAPDEADWARAHELPQPPVLAGLGTEEAAPDAYAPQDATYPTPNAAAPGRSTGTGNVQLPHVHHARTPAPTAAHDVPSGAAIGGAKEETVLCVEIDGVMYPIDPAPHPGRDNTAVDTRTHTSTRTHTTTRDPTHNQQPGTSQPPVKTPDPRAAKRPRVSSEQGLGVKLKGNGGDGEKASSSVPAGSKAKPQRPQHGAKTGPVGVSQGGGGAGGAGREAKGKVPSSGGGNGGGGSGHTGVVLVNGVVESVSPRRLPVPSPDNDNPSVPGGLFSVLYDTFRHEEFTPDTLTAKGLAGLTTLGKNKGAAFGRLKDRGYIAQHARTALRWTIPPRHYWDNLPRRTDNDYCRLVYQTNEETGELEFLACDKEVSKRKAGIIRQLVVQ